MKLLLYCTKVKPYLLHMPKDDEEFKKGIEFSLTSGKEFKEAGLDINDYKLNGKMVAECDFEIEKITDDRLARAISDEMHFIQRDTLLKDSCLTGEEIKKYLKFEHHHFEQEDIVFGYAIHIKNLHIFDEPRELKDFDQVNNCCFEKEVDKDWEGLSIYACVFTNCCRYKSDGHTCDKHFFPLKHIHNMSKVFDGIDCKHKYIMTLSPQEMCRIANKEQTALVRRNVLKEML